MIGVALGWILSELTKLVKWLADGKQRRTAAEQARVLELIHSAELVSTIGNGVATIHAAAASGTPIDAPQASGMVNQFNEAIIELNRLRLEVAILGPKWSQPAALKVENGSLALLAALTEADRKRDQPSFQVLIDQINDFRAARNELIEAAKAEYA